MSNKQAYPRSGLWDYILNSQEDQKIERLRQLRSQIENAKEEFIKGHGNVLEPWVLEKTNKAKSKKIYATSKVISNLYKFTNEFRKNKEEEWIVEELQNFIFRTLAEYPVNGERQDSTHEGIRLWSYGFWDVYYFYNGKKIYIAHISYDKSKIS